MVKVSIYIKYEHVHEYTCTYVFIKSQHLFVIVLVMLLIMVEFAIYCHCSSQPFTVYEEFNDYIKIHTSIYILKIIVMLILFYRCINMGI